MKRTVDNLFGWFRRRTEKTNNLTPSLYDLAPELAVLFALFAFVINVFAGEPYQKYRKDKCEWCGKANVRLVVHHFQAQHVAPELANEPSNLVTLCDPFLSRSTGCHFFFHKRNWTNSVPEIKVLFVKQPKGLRE